MGLQIGIEAKRARPTNRQALDAVISNPHFMTNTSTSIWRTKPNDVDMTSNENETSANGLGVGAKVCVRNRFLGDWTTGFEVAEVLSGGYRIRRLSDGHDFPDVFAFEDVRPERRQHPLREIGRSHLDRRH
jgi:hypothetical protein